jgi:uncharacterized membrane protein YoaK (UPF0700 family)
MHRLEREDFIKYPYAILWPLLAFQAGYLNAFGFLACGRYVSHITGFGSQIGVALAAQKIDLILELLGFPVFFIAGALVSGIWSIALIERKMVPKYDRIVASFPILLTILIIMGGRGTFGVFGEQFVSLNDCILLYLLSFICGLQNGCFSTMTRGQIRTTHLTGVITDIGTDLARMFFGKLNAHELSVTKKVNLSRVFIFISFSLGSVESVIASKKLEYFALFVPLVTSAAIFYCLRKIEATLGDRIKN